MTAISGINNSSANAWADTTKTAKSSSSAEFQAVLDKAESRAKSVTGSDTGTDDTTRQLGRLDANPGLQLTQSQFDTGSASTNQAAGRLPPPTALFNQGSSDDTRSTESATLSKLFEAADTDGSGNIGSQEYARLDEMVQQAMTNLQPTSVTYASTTVSSADASGKDPVSSTDESLSQSYDMNQLAQQVMRQYQQVGNGTTSASASGSTVDTVA
jgi:hypothetical protein